MNNKRKMKKKKKRSGTQWEVIRLGSRPSLEEVCGTPTSFSSTVFLVRR
jgi:hypothetical protein